MFFSLMWFSGCRFSTAAIQPSSARQLPILAALNEENPTLLLTIIYRIDRKGNLHFRFFGKNLHLAGKSRGRRRKSTSARLPCARYRCSAHRLHAHAHLRLAAHRAVCAPRLHGDGARRIGKARAGFNVPAPALAVEEGRHEAVARTGGVHAAAREGRDCISTPSAAT